MQCVAAGQATGDIHLNKVMSTTTRITAYGGGALPVVGTVLLKVWREGSKHHLDCKLVDSPKIRPLLGRQACLYMKIITYLDNDEIHKHNTGSAPVYALENGGPVTIEQLVRDYPTAFGPGVGRLAGKYHIILDESVPPVQHPP